MQRRPGIAAAVLLLAMAVMGAIACSDRGADNAATQPTSPVMPLHYTRITTAQAGLSFEVPADWPRDGEALIWRPAGDDPRRLSVRVVTPAPSDPRSALLDGATIVSQNARDLGWAAGTEYRLRVERDVIPAMEQTHVLVAMGTRTLFDFAFAAPAGADQEPLREAHAHLLGSVVLANPLPGQLPGATSGPSSPDPR